MYLFQVPSKLLISAYDLTINNWAHPKFLFRALLNELSFHYNLSRHPFTEFRRSQKLLWVWLLIPLFGNLYGFGSITPHIR